MSLRNYAIFYFIAGFWLIFGLYRFFGLTTLAELGVFQSDVNLKVGLPVYDDTAISLSRNFLLFFILGQSLVMLQSTRLQFLSNMIVYNKDHISSAAFGLLLVFFAKKSSVFILAPEYLENDRFWVGRGDELRFWVHFFLPNIVGLAACCLIFEAGTRKCKCLILLLLATFAIASFIFGSRGLFVCTSIIIGIGALYLALNTKYFIPILVIGVFSILIALIVGLGYDYANDPNSHLEFRLFFLKILSGISSRLDVMHLVTHVLSTSGCVPLDLSNNWFSRFIGVVGATDWITGVGYPLFLSDCSDHRVYGIVVGGLAIGIISGVLAICVSSQSKIIRAIALYPTIWMGFHWPELSKTDFGVRILEFVMILTAVIFYVTIAARFRSQSAPNDF